MMRNQDRSNSSDLTTLGQRLSFLRTLSGLTQQQLALESGTNQAVIQKIENGRSLRPRKIDEIARALEVNPAWLMFGSERAPIEPDSVSDAIEAMQLISRMEPEEREFALSILRAAVEGSDSIAA